MIPVGEASPPPAPNAVPQHNWYYAINGETSGPFGLAVLKSKYASGSIGDETYVWHDTFPSWVPVATVEVFAEALAKGQALNPRTKTLGYTGPVQAIDGAAPSNERSGTVPKQVRTPEAKPLPRKSRTDKLAKIRNKLGSDTSPQITQTEDWGAMPDTGSLTFDPSVERAGGIAPAEHDAIGPTDPDVFDHVPFADQYEKPAHEIGAGTSSLIGQALGETVEQHDAIPMFPTAGALGGEASSIATTSHSLLIQLDQIQKDGRGKRAAFVGVALVVVLAVIGVGIWTYLNREVEETVTEEKLGLAARTELPTQKKYSSGDQKKFATLELSEETITAVPIEFEEDEVPEIDGSIDPAVKSTKPKLKPKTTAKKKTGKKTKTKTSGGSILDPVSSTTINRPVDQLGSSGALPTSLPKEAAQRGFRRILKAIQVCRERQARRGTFEAKKVKIEVEVAPTGKVSNLSISPASLRSTEFGKCMKSKRGSWRFAQFKGKPVKIKKSIVIQ